MSPSFGTEANKANDAATNAIAFAVSTIGDDFVNFFLIMLFTLSIRPFVDLIAPVIVYVNLAILPIMDNKATPNTIAIILPIDKL